MNTFLLLPVNFEMEERKDWGRGWWGVGCVKCVDVNSILSYTSGTRDQEYDKQLYVKYFFYSQQSLRSSSSEPLLIGYRAGFLNHFAMPLPFLLPLLMPLPVLPIKKKNL